MSIERHYNETFVARLAAREKQMQQHYRPVISVHKWFARRPGSLFRALALAELDDGRVDRHYARPHDHRGVCLDPFMGGGTPLLEAARLGLSVIGYDTNPMARWVVERELEAVDADELAEAGEAVCADVERELGRFYRTTCPGCGADAQARYYLWVRHRRCGCSAERALLADTMVVSTGLGRHPREVHVCPACLAVSEHAPGKRPARCRSCRERYDAHLVAPDSAHVCVCGEPYRIPPQGSVEVPHQRLAVVDYRCEACTPERATRTYKQADERDLRLFERARRLAAKAPSAFVPDDLIPRGEETERLLRWGYNQWRDLFNPRQLLALQTLAARIDEEADGPVKRALQTAFSDVLRYQNMLCRYDRQALKPTDVFAVHGFPVPRVSCEAAPLGVRGTGSGGFRHALAKYERAKRWCEAPYETLPEGGRLRRVPTPGERAAAQLTDAPARLGDGGRAYLRRGSLRAGELEPESVDIVLTDPPYYANVQYAQLMEFPYVWLRRLAAAGFFDTDHARTADDAVGCGGDDPVELADFTDRLADVFCAAAEALKPGGPFMFTYHHNEVAAYAPVVVACLNAGLVPTRFYACPSEMRASTHIHGRNAATVDTVFVLRKPPLPAGVARDHADLDVSRAVAARIAALRRAGMEPTEADRACLRHSALAMQAMARLLPRWDGLALADRLFEAVVALGFALPPPTPATLAPQLRARAQLRRQVGDQPQSPAVESA